MAFSLEYLNTLTTIQAIHEEFRRVEEDETRIEQELVEFQNSIIVERKLSSLASLEYARLCFDSYR